MLTELKRAIAMETANDDVNTDLADDSIKSEYLDDPEGAVIGAENDPEIKKFIEMIPESDDLDPVSEKEVNEVINSVAEATLLEDDVEDVRATNDETDTEEKPGKEIENDLDDVGENFEFDFDGDDAVTEASDEEEEPVDHADDEDEDLEEGFEFDFDGDDAVTEASEDDDESDDDKEDEDNEDDEDLEEGFEFDFDGDDAVTEASEDDDDDEFDDLIDEFIEESFDDFE